MSRLWVDLRVLGYTVASHRWQIALIGLSLMANPNLRQALRHDPLTDEAAARLAATIAGYDDVERFVEEQQRITERLTERQLYWRQQRR